MGVLRIYRFFLGIIWYFVVIELGILFIFNYFIYIIKFMLETVKLRFKRYIIEIISK